MRFPRERYPNQPLKKVEPNRRAKMLCEAKSQTVEQKYNILLNSRILYITFIFLHA
jgi:hypothetical protein